MSRKIDDTKIEAIRRAAVELIATEGVRNCSVSAIAARAGVSSGYMYRFYSGKQELIEDLIAVNFEVISTGIEKMIGQGKGLQEIVATQTAHIVEVADTDPEKIRFLVMLLNDLSVEISPSLARQIEDLAEELLTVARRDDTVREGLTKQDLYVSLISIPLSYMTLRFRDFTGSGRWKTRVKKNIIDASMRLIFKDKPNTCQT